MYPEDSAFGTFTFQAPMASKTISAAVLRSAIPDLSTVDCPCGPIQPAVRIDDILEVIRPLAKPRAAWAEGDVLRVIPVMRNRMCFILGGCSAEASALWGECVGQPCNTVQYCIGCLNPIFLHTTLQRFLSPSGSPTSTRARRLWSSSTPFTCALLFHREAYLQDSLRMLPPQIPAQGPLLLYVQTACLRNVFSS